MKSFIQYLKVFRKPIAVPVFTLFSFFLTILIMLFVLNQTILSSIERKMSQFAEQKVNLGATIKGVDDYKIIEGRIPGVQIDGNYNESNEQSVLGIQSNSFKSYSRTNWLLDSKEKGVLVQSGYGEAFSRTNNGDFPKTLELLGNQFNIVGTLVGPPYSIDHQLYQVSITDFFSILKGKNVNLSLYIPGTPDRFELENMIQDLRDAGVSMSNVRIEDWKSIAVPAAKAEFYFSFLFVVLFLVLNLLFVFNYVLQTRNTKLQLLRLLGLSRLKARLFIVLEIQTLILIAYLFAYLANNVMFPTMQSDITILDHIIIFIYISVLCSGVIFLSTNKIIDKNPTVAIKENLYAQ